MAGSRREFLSNVSLGVMTATLGSSLASELGLGIAAAGETPEALNFGRLEPLAALMQETAPDRLLSVLADRIRTGTELKELVAAGALANARTFGGEDYIGFHTLMAISPSYHRSKEMTADRRALPVLKVLYRNANRIQEHGGRKSEVLKEIDLRSSGPGTPPTAPLGDLIHARNVADAELAFAAMVRRGGAEQAFNELLPTVQEMCDVHRVVLPYRAWDLLDVVGREHAHTLLRQSVRYCLKAETWNTPSPQREPRTLVPRLLSDHRLLDRPAVGTRNAEDAWVDELCKTFLSASPTDAAAAAAAALASGYAPDAIGEAISLAANQLVLRDSGRPAREESIGKPIGSVHGDSIGVHASDTANAWRNMARVTTTRNTFATLITGAYQVALDRIQRGGDFTNWAPLPLQGHVDRVTEKDAPGLLRELEAAIRGNLQARACAVAHKYGMLGHPVRPLMDVLLRFACSEDGSLHAEKYYRTVSDEYATTRPAFRWRHIVGLARVTASEYGRPAPGSAEACRLLNVRDA